MKILMISSYLPFPLYSGGHIRLYNLLKLLSRKHSITLICEKRNYQTEKDVEEVKKICSKLATVDRKKQWSFENVFKTTFSFYPFLLVGHSHKEMKQVIKKELLNNTFDIIHIETSYVFQNLPKTSLPIVLVEHNIEYLVYRRFAEHANFFLRPFLFFDALKLKFWEKFFWKKAKRVVAVSEIEKNLMEIKHVSVVPNGVDIEKFKTQSSKFKTNEGKRILFIGDFKWIQNRDAVIWLVKDIWPVLNSKFKVQNLKLWIVGRKIPNYVRQFIEDQNVIFDENAPEKTEEIYQKSFALVAPIRVGGGTQYKILEAMASGVPVITTKLGVEGLEALDRKEVLVADSTEAFVSSLKELRENDELRNRLIKNARKLVTEEYDWKIIAGELEKVYQESVV